MVGDEAFCFYFLLVLCLHPNYNIILLIVHLSCVESYC